MERLAKVNALAFRGAAVGSLPARANFTNTPAYWPIAKL